MTNKLIGKYFGGHSIKHSRTSIFKCTGVDKDNVFVTNIIDPEDKPALSPRAIGRTFHPATQEGIDVTTTPNKWYVYGLWNQFITL